MRPVNRLPQRDRRCFTPKRASGPTAPRTAASRTAPSAFSGTPATVVSMTRPDSARLPRFSLTERAAHWFMAATFLAMLGSGVTIGGIGPFGHRAVLGVHLVSAALLIVGVGLLMIRASARRQLAGTARELGRLTAKDRAWLRAAPHRVLRGVPLPTAGRFNGGQKMNSPLLPLMLCVLYPSGTGQPARHRAPLGPLRPPAGGPGLAPGA